MKLPVAGWLPAYRREWLRADTVAGLTAAAVVIPKAMAIAAIAGLPVEIGLYTALAAMLVYPRRARSALSRARQRHQMCLRHEPAAATAWNIRSLSQSIIANSPMTLLTTLVPLAQGFRPVNHFGRVSLTIERHCSWEGDCTILRVRQKFRQGVPHGGGHI
jgi:hypothetical protein